jgi:hypothetical protein
MPSKRLKSLEDSRLIGCLDDTGVTSQNYKQILSNFLNRERQMTEWQPFETAPKDGTKILAFWSEYWEHPLHWEPEIMKFDVDKGWWVTWDVDWEDVGSVVRPAFWIPLPEPPQPVREEYGGGHGIQFVTENGVTQWESLNDKIGGADE